MKNEIVMEILKKIENNEISMQDGDKILNCIDNSLYYKLKWNEEELKGSFNKIDNVVFLFPDMYDYINLSKYIDLEKNICIVNGSLFKKADNNLYKIDFTNEEHYNILLDVWKNEGVLPNNVAYVAKKSNGYNVQGIREDMQYGIYSIFLFVKNYIMHLPDSELNFITVIQESDPINTSLIGFAKTVKQEHQLINMRCISFSDEYKQKLTPEKLIDVVYQELSSRSEDQEVMYSESGRMISCIEEVAYTENKTGNDYNNKNFVIVGSGGLGKIIAEQYAKNNCRVALIGRKNFDGDISNFISGLNSKGYNVRYYQADVLNEEEVSAVADQISNDLGRVDCLCYTVGIISDSLLIKKTKEEFAKVAEAKIIGITNVISAFNGKKVKNAVLFSSLASLSGNIGQCDYAYANAFLNKIAENSEKYTDFERTTSICWPYWKNGRMQIENNVVKMMERNLGIEPLETEAGLIAMDLFLNSSDNVCGVLSGDHDKIKNLTTNNKKNTADENIFEEKQEYSVELLNDTKELLKNIFSHALKLPAERVNTSATFDTYGVDSIIVNAVNIELTPIFGDVDGTLLFQYNNIDKLAEYFAENYTDVLSKKFNKRSAEQVKTEIAPKAEVNKEESKKIGFNCFRKPVAAKEKVYVKADDTNTDIAIIGISGKYPMAEDLDEFWSNLKEGKDCIIEIPEERWDVLSEYTTDRSQFGKIFSKWGGFVKNADLFDAKFFNISPREAEFLDPQEKLFLESCWLTLQNGGYKHNELMGRKVGVFAGVMYGEHQIYRADFNGMPIALSSSYASIANRVSYVFGFHGPSIALDTMCSSSLTAIHLACESLKNGESELALAGGVNLNLHPNKYRFLSQQRFLSSDGRCRAYGANGDGYVPAEGVGTILLKPLFKAIEDNDYIYAVIKGTAINHGGRANGYTVPNPNAQRDVILEASKNASVDLSTVNYMEGHGTGTELGDPIELTGLSEAVKKYTSDKQFCAIGSVKSNIGHAESAAGIAAITKVILQLQNKQLVPSIHTEELNPKINFAKTPFYVQKKLAPWKKIEKDGKEYPRRAGISSFGAGGANAHILIEEYEDQNISVSGNNKNKVVCLSAPNKKLLKKYAESICRFIEEKIEQNDNASFDNFAYSLQIGRDLYCERLAVIADCYEECLNKIQGYLDGDKNISGVYIGNVDQNKQTLENLFDQDEISVLVSNALSKGQIEKVCKFWISGVDFSWEAIYSQTDSLHKLPIPNVPMELISYKIKKYVETIAVQKSADVPKVIETVNNRVNEVFGIKKIWKEKSLIKSGINDEKRLLIISDANGSSLISARIREEGSFTKIYENRTTDLIGYVEMLEGMTDSFPTDVVFIGSALRVSDNILENAVNEFANVLYFAQALQKIKYFKKIRIAYLYVSDNGSYFNSAMNGLMKNLKVENPMFVTKCIEIQNVESSRASENDIARCICDELSEKQWDESYVKYIGNVRQTERFVPFEIENDENISLTSTDVVIISGGAGGIGEKIAISISEKYHAVTVLFGRSAMNDRIEKLVSKINEKGGRAKYISCDISDYAEVGSCIDKVRAEYGKITGIIHCAGVLQDDFYINKTEETVRKVLAPKIKGTLNLNNAIKDERIKFFVLFSSITSEVGNPGQCDYAFANSFLDRFAEERQRMIDQGKLYGKTISINWPFWEDGGMNVDSKIIENVFDITGFLPMPSDVGIDVLYHAINADIYQFIVCYGDKEKIQHLFERREVSAETEDVSAVSSEELYNAAANFVKKLIGDIVNIPADELDSKMTFQDLGIDSNAISYFNAEIEKSIPDIPKTVLFQFTNVDEVVDFLIENYEEQLCRILFLEKKSKIKTVTADKLLSDNSKTVISSSDDNNKKNEKIAIIGLSGKYPDAENVEQFWDNLISGKESISEVPKERWDVDKYYADKSSAHPGKMYCKWGGFLSGADMFDPLFFKISPAEAVIMDPQERLFLEVAWETMEDAGYIPRKRGKFNDYEKQVGVFVGVTTNSYQLWGPGECERGNYIFPNSVNWSIANRVSYLFDFHGPSVPVDTACSSSLEAVHLAVESIRNGECKMAIAGGVNLYLHPYKYMSMSQLKMLSPTGHCYTFSDKADGFVPGEGVGAILLKSLEEAERDGDHIYGIIQSSSVNHGGASNGYTVPNQTAQTELILNALKKANVDPEQISYVEAHGTGTKLGDPIEIEALKNAYGKYTSKKQYCAIGSVKTNIGHLESAAGIAGITKILMQMKYHKLAPSLHAEVKNKNIRFEDTPFVVQEGADEWKISETQKRIAAISAFGAGGANNHIILEEYIDKKNADTTSNENIFIISAQSLEILKKYAALFYEYFSKERSGSLNLDSAAYTMQVGREEMPYRAAIVYSRIEDILIGLNAIQADIKTDSVYLGKKENSFRSDISENEIKTMILQHDYNKIAQNWVRGVNILWSKLYDGVIKKVSLPKYPFQNESYYITRTDLGLDNTSENIAISDTVEDDSVNYVVPVWREAEISSDNTEIAEKNILILYTDISEKLKQHISEYYHAGNIIAIPLSEMEKGIAELATDYLPDRIYYLDLISNNYEIDDIDKLKQIINDNLIKYHNFIKLIENKGVIRKGLLFNTVVNNTCTGFNGSDIYAFSGGISGLTRTLSKEFPDVRFCCVDVDEKECNEETEIVANQIVCEISQKKDNEIAFRNSKRWSRSLRKETISLKESRFRNNGTYLIAGGLGNVGYSISKHLSKKYYANLIIIGRSSLDAQKENKIEKLKQLGGKVMYFQGRVEDKQDIQNAFDSGIRAFGRIDGVIHSVMHDPIPQKVVDLSTDEYLATLSPKTEGIVSFCNIAAQKNVDFILLLSSGQVFTGNPYRGHYASACCFEDEFAYSLQRKYNNLVYIINMGFWGVANDKPLNEEYRKMILDTGAYPLEENEGINCIEKILSNDKLQVCILKVKDYVLRLMQVDNINVVAANDNKNEKIENKAVNSGNVLKIKQIVNDSVMEVLQIKEKDLNDDKPFMDMGIDSISGERLINMINAKLGIEIPQTVLFDYSTAAALAEYLAKEAGNDLNTDAGNTIAETKEDDIAHLFEMFQNGEITEEILNDLLEEHC